MSDAPPDARITGEAGGGCLCGAVRYRLRAAPSASVICHCRSCRRGAGAPAVAWMTFDRVGDVDFSGDLARFASSRGVTRGFCGCCGTALTYATADSADSLDVTTASLDDPARYPPIREVWLAHRLPWTAVAVDRECHARGSGDGADAPGDGE